jgi:hypothetical protein
MRRIKRYKASFQGADTEMVDRIRPFCASLTAVKGEEAPAARSMFPAPYPRRESQNRKE